MKKPGQKQEKEFIESFEKLSDSLFRHAFFRVSNRDTALEIVQEAFTKTWQHIARGGEIENMKAFLYHATNNLIIDYYRKRKSDSLDSLLDEGFDPETRGDEEIIAKAEYSEVERILKSLPEKDRDVIVMRYIDGFGVKEIAESLGENENNVSVRLHRALGKVREILNP